MQHRTQLRGAEPGAVVNDNAGARARPPLWRYQDGDVFLVKSVQTAESRRTRTAENRAGADGFDHAPQQLHPGERPGLCHEDSGHGHLPSSGFHPPSNGRPACSSRHSGADRDNSALVVGCLLPGVLAGVRGHAHKPRRSAGRTEYHLPGCGKAAVVVPGCGRTVHPPGLSRTGFQNRFSGRVFRTDAGAGGAGQPRCGSGRADWRSVRRILDRTRRIAGKPSQQS